MHSGRLIKEKYHVAAIFVDHISHLTYIPFQKSTSAAKTVLAKHEFEQYANTFGNTIKNYQADNGAFNTNLFKESIIAAK